MSRCPHLLAASFFAVFVLAFSASPLSAAATGTAIDKSGPKPLGKFGYWTAYSATDSGQPVCYMSLVSPAPQDKKPDKKADKKQPKKAKRGDITLMITHRPSESSSDVISYAAGTKFKPASEVQVSVGAKQFSLFTQSDTAWSRDAVTDHAIASAIRHGASMTVIGVSAQGVKIADTVQLKGASAAYAAIGKACGLVVDEPKPKQAAQKTVKKAK